MFTGRSYKKIDLPVFFDNWIKTENLFPSNKLQKIYPRFKIIILIEIVLEYL